MPIGQPSLACGKGVWSLLERKKEFDVVELGMTLSILGPISQHCPLAYGPKSIVSLLY